MHLGAKRTGFDSLWCFFDLMIKLTFSRYLGLVVDEVKNQNKLMGQLKVRIES